MLVYNLSMERQAKISTIVKNLPTSSGVYKMLDENGFVLYIGKAKNLKSRVSSYFNKTAKNLKTMKLVKKIVSVDYILTHSEKEALSLESNMVYAEQPYYNILLKDDKAFPYIKIYKHQDFPKIEITRRVKKDEAYYFGPFFGNIKCGDIMKIIQSVFRLRTCNLKISETKKHKKPCLKYHIGQCSAPCVFDISSRDYGKEIEKVIAFLKGDYNFVKNQLFEKMMKFSDVEQYEKAKEIKDMIASLQNLNNYNVTELNQQVDADVFGVAKDGEKAVISVAFIRGGKMVGVKNYQVDMLLEEDFLDDFMLQYYLDNPHIPEKIVANVAEKVLVEEFLSELKNKKITLQKGERGVAKKLKEMAQQNALEQLKRATIKATDAYTKTIGALYELKLVLELAELPNRIECFDISNLGSTNIVASMVVFEKGVAKKSHYRKFKVNIDVQNDYDSLRDVVARRIKNLSGNDVSFSCVPDLMVIDGGKGQLSAVMESTREHKFSTNIISLAKKEEEIFLPHSTSSVKLPKSSPALKLLQSIRDESHRFAITFQRATRLKKSINSKLSQIKGLSEKKEKALISAFKSVENIKNADVETLTKVEGIGKNLAQKILEHLNK